MTKQTRKPATKKQAKKSAKKPFARMVSFTARKHEGKVYFTPVNKRAKKLARKFNIRTRVEMSHLKAFKAEGEYKFGVYVPVSKDSKAKKLISLAV